MTTSQKGRDTGMSSRTGSPLESHKTKGLALDVWKRRESPTGSRFARNSAGKSGGRTGLGRKEGTPSGKRIAKDGGKNADNTFIN